jgi:hypothetical protein
MKTRPLDILDLPTIARYRNQALSLDASRLLTRGNPLGAGGFLSYFNPVRHIYTCVAQENNTTLLGNVIHTGQDTFAKLVYLAPNSELAHPGLVDLVEDLASEAGKWGAFHLRAELEETSEAFPSLHKTGFSVYASQRIWDISQLALGPSTEHWMPAQPIHLPAIHSLHYLVTPPLLQPVEKTPKQASGLISSDGIKCYINLTRGPKGILLMPLIHPETTDVAERLLSILNHIPTRGNRPVYLCIRSYQEWLAPILEGLGAKVSPKQAVMVKHLARMIKEDQPVNAAEKGWAKPATPVAQISKRDK